MITTELEAVYIRLEGYSAFFRFTGIISGRQITRPCPTYANLLGLISAVTGKIVTPRDTRIGFEFSSVSKADDLQRTDRLEYNRSKKLKEHSEGKGLLNRQVHFRPVLDLYLTNLDLLNYFTNPKATPTLGRSEDLCWISKTEKVTLTPVASGRVGITRIGRPDRQIDLSIPSSIDNCAEWFSNDDTGYTRLVMKQGYYQVTELDNDTRVKITTDNLYHPSNLPENDVIYLHQWL